jgi:hypothetical protein
MSAKEQKRRPLEPANGFFEREQIERRSEHSGPRAIPPTFSHPPYV